jgi:hypothetical protein
LTACAAGLDSAEREAFKLLLAMAATTLAPGDRSQDGSSPQAFQIVGETLLRLQPHHDRIPRNGTAWRGRPEFLTGARLEELRTEAVEGRPTAFRLNGRDLGYPGRVAAGLAVSRPLIDLVRAHAGECEPTARAAYVYYDSRGQGVYPHVDASSYSLTALFMIAHSYRSAPRSHHLHFLPDGSTERFDLEPGEMLLFHAASVVHARTPVGSDEAVTILTIGFQPL